MRGFVENMNTGMGHSFKKVTFVGERKGRRLMKSSTDPFIHSSTYWWLSAVVVRDDGKVEDVSVRRRHSAAPTLDETWLARG